MASFKCLEDPSSVSRVTEYDTGKIVSLHIPWVIDVHPTPQNVLYNSSRNLVSRWSKGSLITFVEKVGKERTYKWSIENKTKTKQQRDKPKSEVTKEHTEKTDVITIIVRRKLEYNA